MSKTKTQDSRNDALSESDHSEPEFDAMDEVMKQLKPLIAFQKELESSKEGDLQMIWDVRVVKGADTPFASSQGTSSMPGALAPKMAPIAPGLLEREIFGKITRPLVAFMQHEAERQCCNDDSPQGTHESDDDIGSPPDMEGWD